MPRFVVHFDVAFYVFWHRLVQRKERILLYLQILLSTKIYQMQNKLHGGKLRTDLIIILADLADEIRRSVHGFGQGPDTSESDGAADHAALAHFAQNMDRDLQGDCNFGKR